MKQLYLIKNILGEPNSQCLAEIYLDNEIKLNPTILINLDRIITILENIKFDGDLIAGLKRIDKNTYSIVDKDYRDPITGERIQYQIIKKINLCEHVYEIRFTSFVSNRIRNCRIFFTFNLKKKYILWTHGFTKISNISTYYGKLRK